MKHYDYSFLRSMAVPADCLDIIGSMSDVFRVSVDKLQTSPDIFSELKNIARLQSVKSGNAIAGIATADKRIKEIVNSGCIPINDCENEIAGYRDALDMIFSHHKTLSINEETIMELHKVLLSRTHPDYGGTYKTENNIIKIVYDDGLSFFCWASVPAEDTAKSMHGLISAYTDAVNDPEISPLLLIPCFIFDFYCIHPFRYGNGRMSRLLSILLLCKCGFDIPMYVSFEDLLYSIQEDYYNALKQSYIGWHENSNSYIPFIENFINTLSLCCKKLDSLTN